MSETKSMEPDLVYVEPSDLCQINLLCIYCVFIGFNGFNAYKFVIMYNLPVYRWWRNGPAIDNSCITKYVYGVLNTIFNQAIKNY